MPRLVRTESINVRLTEEEIARLDQVVAEREATDPGTNITRASVARSILLRGLPPKASKSRRG